MKTMHCLENALSQNKKCKEEGLSKKLYVNEQEWFRKRGEKKCSLKNLAENEEQAYWW